MWLLKGNHEAPGWRELETDARAEKIEVVLFDRDAWALVNVPEAPAQYEGLVPTSPPDGLYLDNQGRSVYLVGGQRVPGPKEVLAAIGPAAGEALEKYGDPDTALQRLGRVY
jgi:hypothetical protein